ncbi:MAG: hypothetical protein V4596_04275 [Bdellovibrionota bacterium]
MDPRSSSSQKHKYQPVPKDFLKLVKETFEEKYADFLKDKTLIVDGAIFPEELILVVGIKNNNEKIRQVNFESSMDYENVDDTKVLEKIHMSIDALDAMFIEYVEANGDIEMPKLWTEFEFEGQKLYLKSSTDNIELEKAAEEFLRQHDTNSSEETIH